MIAKSKNRERNSAFTLLELLVALSLTAVLAGSLYASLFIGFKAYERATESLEPARAVEFAFELLREDLLSTMPPVGILAGEFSGTDESLIENQARDQLLFHSSANEPGDDEIASDLRKVEFLVEEDSESRQTLLVRRLTSNLLASTIPEPVTETLCRQVVSFNLRYFDGSAWHDSWDSTTNDNALPAAVEVQLSILRPDSETIYKMTRLFPIPSQSPESQGGVEILRGGSS
tara:strand:+ start:529 stop:1224 length:696 start_codon:yes stop_codon:yes gene_type:complete